MSHPTRRRLPPLLVLLGLFGLLLATPFVFAQDRPAALAPSAPDRLGLGSGFYIENGLNQTPRPPDPYYAVGSYRFWDWKSLNPQKNVYSFDVMDSWISSQLNAGYKYVGFAFVTYTGRPTRCPTLGIESTPAWVRFGPDGQTNTADDPIITAANPDIRDCNGDGSPDNGPWYLIDYSDAYYQSQYTVFIDALADHLRSHPQASQFGWVAIGVGKDGENKAVDPDDRASLNMSSAQWVAFGQSVSLAYKNAFESNNGQPKIRVMNQNATFHQDVTERRTIADWAASQNIGLSVNVLTSDFTLIESCQSLDPNRKCVGTYDQLRKYADTVPSAVETYAYMLRTANEFYWGMARALDVHVDVIRLSAFWNVSGMDTPTNRSIAQWADKYLGTGLQAGDTFPPSIWSRMREHKNPTYLPYAEIPHDQYHDWPTNGNYEYYLYQRHTIPGGVTIPITDDPRFQSNGGITGWDAPTSNVLDKPYHYNTQPYNAVLNSAGLYQVDAGAANKVQIQVDPGWVARRSNQANGNYGFFFDADGRYLAPPTGNAHEVAIAVTYLDAGNDRFRLKYDSTTGEKAARVYAIQDWSVATGLAIDKALPTTGLQPANTFYVQKTNTNAWKTATFYIQDGYFGTRLAANQADFYIDSRSDADANDGDEYIHHVDVRKLNNAPQVTATPTPTGQVVTSTPTPTGQATATPTRTPTPTATLQATTGSLSGYIFEDLDFDWVRDGGEPPLPGALVRLYASDNTTLITEVVSDNAGFYRFPGLNPAVYSIRVTPPQGWTMVIQQQWAQVIAGQEIGDKNFPANRIPTATPTVTATPTPTPTATPTGGRIEGIVWHDLDQDGNHEPGAGETGVANVTLRLRTVQGQLLSEQVTDSEGRYGFGSLASQTYELVLVVPANWQNTTPPNNRFLAPGNGVLSQDFGLFALPTPTPTPTATPSGAIHAYVFNDLNKDGDSDDGEPPLAGVEIIVYRWPGQQEVARDATGGDGYAQFVLAAPGSYRLVEIDPTGLTSSTPNDFLAALSPNQTLELHFGDYDGRVRIFLPLLWRNVGP